ncbi:MAG: hypothetical protein XXXJIFNMEKO3_02229 [Candidatus Erwinia impunctatus]|nr:hypothetical protein XXXJIFNMEKO_02229 [Culicoides impunctatus]
MKVYNQSLSLMNNVKLIIKSLPTPSPHNTSLLNSELPIKFLSHIYVE